MVRSLDRTKVGEQPFKGPSYLICFEAYSEKARFYHGRAIVYFTVWRSKPPLRSGPRPFMLS